MGQEEQESITVFKATFLTNIIAGAAVCHGNSELFQINYHILPGKLNSQKVNTIPRLN